VQQRQRRRIVRAGEQDLPCLCAVGEVMDDAKPVAARDGGIENDQFGLMIGERGAQAVGVGALDRKEADVGHRLAEKAPYMRFAADDERRARHAPTPE
jgi:hypothetical protein